MKNVPDTFSIDFACLQNLFKTVILYSFLDKIGKHAQVKHFPKGSAKYACFTTDYNG